MMRAAAVIIRTPWPQAGGTRRNFWLRWSRRTSSGHRAAARRAPPGLTPDDLLPILADAALAHYAGFGHSLIYVVKTIELAQRLGSQVAEPLLRLLARSSDLCPARGFVAGVP